MKSPLTYAVPDLDELQLERKIRLLTLTSLAFDNVGRDLSYSAIAAALQVETSEVEKWAIDGNKIKSRHFNRSTDCILVVIRAGLLSGKLSQTCQVLHINRSTSRAFERRQWEALEQRLLAWKTGLGAVLDVVASTRRNDELSTGDVGATAAAITTSSETAVQTTVTV
jgi:translation initiation factor 3 subunit M